MAPFTVLHVCMGNICRSPMAERLLTRAVAERAAALGGSADGTDLVLSHSAGTGGWHEDEEMNPSAARQVRARGASPDGFSARKLRAEHIEAADLILTATADQYDYVTALRPDAADRTFVLGEFGRLLPGVDVSELPPADPTPDAVYNRGVALVAAVAAARNGEPAQPKDDLDDPWGRGDQVFTRVGDEIQDVLTPLTATLLPLP
ncbi:phosphotyrosine protein phosphatase [Catellatospora sp. KI3]|uniref:arsenate reductase/protein-tyrosine-phosphatase family protein n=1 Tax=Catellatospora sp. KI3 TaxID=3041620 RepID=UPI0024824209|nr:phosphotyrosine protein phosphatase [Catellatospora sp. KI3]MDI1459688.1 phosphotyrosine protein phosphatase [Catellatospora sp. KI3]